VTNFNDLQTLRSRAGLGLATLAAAIVIAGCGSSSSSSTASSTPTSTPTASTSTPTASTATPTASTGTTPTSGPLSKEPKVTPPAGPVPAKLVTREIVTGTGPEAKTGEDMTINYVASLYKGGKVLDSSWSRNTPFRFILGNSILAGWNQGIVGMKVGGRRELIMPASLAWGKHGRAPSIPPNAAVVFVVDLLRTAPIGAPATG
jgi:peptidylprolyl isomerase